MPLILLIVAALGMGLGLVQAWTIWFLKREVQRLEFKLSEALDDEDLLEFQERLKALLDQAKKTALDLAEGVDERRDSLEKALEKARLAEKSLALRILAKSATSESPVKSPAPKTVKKADKHPAKTSPKATASPGSQLSASPVRSRTPASPVTVRETPAAEGEARRSYVARPPASPARYQNIYDLADQGLSPEQIAKNSGILAGEVALILNLRRKEPPKA